MIIIFFQWRGNEEGYDLLWRGMSDDNYSPSNGGNGVDDNFLCRMGTVLIDTLGNSFQTKDAGGMV